jgi:RNA polymerase sigma-70 factor (ECF subfamily)
MTPTPSVHRAETLRARSNESRGSARAANSLSREERSREPESSLVAVAFQRPGTDAESALIERVLAGEGECFYELIKPYERALYVAAQSVMQNEADAEDVAQEAVLKAFANLAEFRRESKFSTWLIQITINEARMRRRKNRPHLYDSLDEPQRGEEGDYMPRDFADWREIPSEALERKEVREALERAITALDPKYREVLMLRDVQQLSIAETAQALAISEANVKTRLLRARLQVRDALAPGVDGAWSAGENSWKKVRPW